MPCLEKPAVMGQISLNSRGGSMCSELKLCPDRTITDLVTACWADDIALKDFLEIKVIKISHYSAAGSGRLLFVNHQSNCGGAGVGPGGGGGGVGQR